SRPLLSNGEKSKKKIHTTKESPVSARILSTAASALGILAECWTGGGASSARVSHPIKPSMPPR
ncbi:MAG: hypothetical protein WAN65_24355, partial [Candidatus Sulfotelmatobacter sp.]